MFDRSDSRTSGASRRDFLRTSGVVAGAALAGNLAIVRSAHAQGSDTLKIGLIGCGGRGTGAANNAMQADPNTRLVAMGDLFMDKIQRSRNYLKKRKPKQMAVDDDLERTVLALDQLGLDAVLRFDVVRQTGGTRTVVSNDAVFDGQHELLRRGMLSVGGSGRSYNH